MALSDLYGFSSLDISRIKKLLSGFIIILDSKATLVVDPNNLSILDVI